MTAGDEAALVRVETADGVARVTLDRPARHNSLVPALLEQLRDAARRLGADETVRAVVLAGAGRSFSTGGDVAAFHDAGDGVAAYAERVVGLLNETVLALLDLPQPLIVRLHGPVTGGSLGLVLAADLVAMTPEAFIAPYYVEVGFAPDGGWRAILPERIGRARAAEIQLRNRHVGADEAVRLGLATEVVAADALDARIAEWTDGLAAKVPGGLAAAKAGLLPPERRAAYADGLEAERRAFVDRVARPETRAGMARFLGRAA